MRRSILQSLPEMAPVDRNMGPGDVTFTGYDVYSWSPGQVGENVPCTEVHLSIPVPGVRFALRLKSARALDELVGALLQHRRDVWGDGT